VRETEIQVEQQPPQGVFVFDHAGLVINQFSLYRALQVQVQRNEAELANLKEWMVRREAEVSELRAAEHLRIKVSTSHKLTCLLSGTNTSTLEQKEAEDLRIMVVQRFRGGLVFKAHRLFYRI